MRAALLSGGAGHGGFQVGVLSRLGTLGEIGYDFIYGTSVGAVNGAFIYGPKASQNGRGTELPLIWEREVLGNDSVFRMRFGGPLGVLLSGKEALADTSPLLKIIQKYWNGPTPGVSFTVTTVDEMTGEVLEFTESNDDVPTKILASAAYPCVFDPVPYKRKNAAGATLAVHSLIDGGARDIIPHRSAIMEPDITDIDVIVCKPVEGGLLPMSPGRKMTLVDHALRTIEIMADEIFRGDIARLKEWCASSSGRRLRIFAPEAPIETDALDFRRSYRDLLFERGKKAAEKPFVLG